MSCLPPTRLLIPPVAVAEIELAEPVTVTHIADGRGIDAAGGTGGTGGDADGHTGGHTGGHADGHAGGHAGQALVLARLHGRPLGTVVIDAPGGAVDAQRCASAAWSRLGTSLHAHLDADGLPPCPPVTGKPGGRLPRCRQDAAAVQASAPSVSVVIATRDRPGYLAACLDSLAKLDYPDYEVLVVDNAPASAATARLVRHRGEPNVRYVRESQRGLAAAHNCGLRLAEGVIVAFTDDDVIVDENWLTEVASAFRVADGVACVTGLIMPAELRTQAQLLLEAHGNFGKGYRQRVLDRGIHRPADPLFPFTAGQLGSGANMSFNRDALRALGGFDPATGAGTIARGGDDLAAFFAVLAAGHGLVYQPAALVWHRHRQDAAALSSQAYGYGVGLGAYVASILANHPGVIGHALRRVPQALSYALHPRSPRNAHRHRLWSRELIRLERRGLVFGPLAYGISRLRTREARRKRATWELTP